MKKNILVVLPVKNSHKNLLESCAPGHNFIYTNSASVTAEQLGTANVIIGNLPPALIKTAPNIEWLQLNSAGTDGYCTPGVLPEKAKLTNATGAYGLAISEYMLASVMAIQKKLHRYHDNQQKHQWKDEGEVTSIDSAVTLIVGLGDIGGDFARKIKALGGYTIGIRRTASAKPDYLDELRTMDELDTLLSKADIVALSLPETPATHHLFDKTKLSKIKPGSILVNVGRGSAIVTDDLCDAVESGRLLGAALDVTEPEPLPEDHRIWDVPGIYITPHTSGQYHLPETFERIVRISARNLKAFLAGQTLENEVDFTTGYRKRN